MKLNSVLFSQATEQIPLDLQYDPQSLAYGGHVS